jgi:hypothetical protein
LGGGQKELEALVQNNKRGKVKSKKLFYVFMAVATIINIGLVAPYLLSQPSSFLVWLGIFFSFINLMIVANHFYDLLTTIYQNSKEKK